VGDEIGGGVCGYGGGVERGDLGVEAEFFVGAGRRPDGAGRLQGGFAWPRPPKGKHTTFAWMGFWAVDGAFSFSGHRPQEKAFEGTSENPPSGSYRLPEGGFSGFCATYPLAKIPDFC